MLETNCPCREDAPPANVFHAEVNPSTPNLFLEGYNGGSFYLRQFAGGDVGSHALELSVNPKTMFPVRPAEVMQGVFHGRIIQLVVYTYYMVAASAKRIIEKAGYKNWDELASRYVEKDIVDEMSFDDSAEYMGFTPLEWRVVRTEEEFIRAVYRQIIVLEAGTPDKMRERIAALQVVASDPTHKQMVQAQKLLESQLGVLRGEGEHQQAPAINLEVNLVQAEPIPTPTDGGEVREETGQIRAKA